MRSGTVILFIASMFLMAVMPVKIHSISSGSKYIKPVRDSCDSIPAPIGHVNDFEHILTPGQIGILEEMIREYEDSTSNQIALVTIPTTMVTYANFERFTLQMINCWHVGQKFKNNGILIGISAGYKRIRIQNGYGIEKVLSNAETKRIIDVEFVPNFKRSHYYDGIYYGLKSIMFKAKKI